MHTFDAHMVRPWEADIELGQQRVTSSSGTICPINRSAQLLSWIKFSPKSAPETKDYRRPPTRIEDYPSGYPRFSALIASHASFHLCRRFSNLRARQLLLKQDKLSLLEKRLEKIDRENLAFLGCSRIDTNNERGSILLEIDTALAEYDTLLERNRQALSFEGASHRAVASLQNWVDGNGCIAREETAYLARAEDLLCVVSPDDNAVSSLGTLIEDSRVYFREKFGQRSQLDISGDPNVHIFPSSSITLAARMLMTPFIIVLLLTPVIICSFVDSLTARLVVIIMASAGFVLILSGLTKARTIELVVAVATYITVLVVFISNTNAPGN